MSLSAPTQLVFLIAVIAGILGIVGSFVVIPMVSANAFWLVAAGFVLLALGSSMKGL
ncbi:MAG: hypothetical protein LJE84_01650 [Gammaproteobacteria bacterium]|jgi:hypothetical protein|nr:hypothetical protein [Gammaproteobacteria bacterium]